MVHVHFQWLLVTAIMLCVRKSIELVHKYLLIAVGAGIALLIAVGAGIALLIAVGAGIA